MDTREPFEKYFEMMIKVAELKPNPANAVREVLENRSKYLSAWVACQCFNDKHIQEVEEELRKLKEQRQLSDIGHFFWSVDGVKKTEE